MSEPLRFAVVGAGGFARFATAQFIRHPGVQLAAVHDPDPQAMAALASLAPDVRAFADLQRLLADPALDLVYIASPPFLHHEQGMQALRAGKHVICEKPAALTAAQAREMQQEAARRGLLFVVNLMQRYNPLYDAVAQLVQRRLLGEFLHGFFENYACDEFLPAGHWFWDEGRSGGIFIEHGVHFFDMFAGWLGEGRVLSAQKIARPGHPGIWDTVQCTVLYGGHAPVHFFHAFNQPKVLDRQEMRLQFERGEITLHEWVPTRLVLNAAGTRDDALALQALFPQARVEVVEAFEPALAARGRFKPLRIEQRWHLDTGQATTKAEVYEGLVRDMWADQLGWLADRNRRRRIDTDNAVTSVAVAEQADQIAVRVA